MSQVNFFSADSFDPNRPIESINELIAHGIDPNSTLVFLPNDELTVEDHLETIENIKVDYDGTREETQLNNNQDFVNLVKNITLNLTKKQDPSVNIQSLTSHIQSIYGAP